MLNKSVNEMNDGEKLSKEIYSLEPHWEEEQIKGPSDHARSPSSRCWPGV